MLDIIFLSAPPNKDTSVEKRFFYGSVDGVSFRIPEVFFLMVNIAPFVLIQLSISVIKNIIIILYYIIF